MPSPRLKSAASPEDCLVDALLNKKGPPGLDVCVRVCEGLGERGPFSPPMPLPPSRKGASFLAAQTLPAQLAEFVSD